MTRAGARLFLSALALLATAACSGRADDAQPVSGDLAADLEARDSGGARPTAVSPLDALPAGVRALLDTPFTGDFAALTARRLIRVGVTFDRTQYFIDRGEQRGLAYESLKSFEDELNTRLKTRNLRVHVVPVPLPRDLLLPALVKGQIDMVAAMLTITPEREALVSFTQPTRTNVNEVVVSGPASPVLATVDDLSGQEVFVRKSSSYYSSLVRLNQRLTARGKPPVVITLAPEALEDDDLIEMVNAGLVPATVVDDYMADFWKQVFTAVTVHHEVAVRSGGTLAVAVRKENPRLREAANSWIRKHGDGDALRNVLQQRYLSQADYVKNAAAKAERRKFEAMVGLFQKYGARYSVDYLLMAAQGYQESTLNQNMKSRNGAIGVMQVMPRTGRELKVGNITQLEPNIHAGVKYIRLMMDRYFGNQPMDDLNKGLMTFASYNAGPRRVAQLRTEAARRGLNPNVWFGNVERVASERIGRETVQYVSNIYKYYIAYRLALSHREQRDAAKAQFK